MDGRTRARAAPRSPRRPRRARGRPTASSAAGRPVTARKDDGVAPPPRAPAPAASASAERDAPLGEQRPVADEHPPAAGDPLDAAAGGRLERLRLERRGRPGSARAASTIARRERVLRAALAARPRGRGAPLARVALFRSPRDPLGQVRVRCAAPRAATACRASACKYVSNTRRSPGRRAQARRRPSQQHPAARAAPVASSTAMGVARPSAHGQAITTTETTA